MRKSADIYAHQDDDSEGFYSRWSKRKVQDQNNQDLLTQTSSTDTISDSHLYPELSPETGQENKLLCDEDMPDIDTLDEDSDYSGFLSPGVTDNLRKLALHKLFHGQSFNLCDGLDDYDEEFTSFEKLGDIVTADMRFQLEEEAKRKLQLESENTDLEKPGFENSGLENTSIESIDEPSLAENTDMDDNEVSSKQFQNSKLPENENPA